MPGIRVRYVVRFFRKGQLYGHNDFEGYQSDDISSDLFDVRDDLDPTFDDMEPRSRPRLAPPNHEDFFNLNMTADEFEEDFYVLKNVNNDNMQRYVNKNSVVYLDDKSFTMQVKPFNFKSYTCKQVHDKFASDLKYLKETGYYDDVITWDIANDIYVNHPYCVNKTKQWT